MVLFVVTFLPVSCHGGHGNGCEQLFQRLDGLVGVVADVCMTSLSVLAGPLEKLDIGPSMPPSSGLRGGHATGLTPWFPRKRLYTPVPAVGRVAGSIVAA